MVFRVRLEAQERELQGLWRAGDGRGGCGVGGGVAWGVLCVYGEFFLLILCVGGGGRVRWGLTVCVCGSGWVMLTFVVFSLGLQGAVQGRSVLSVGGWGDGAVFWV